MEIHCSNSFDKCQSEQASPQVSWHAMFEQLKDWKDLGHRKGYPPRIARWMAAQRRQYRPYGIGKKPPVGIIKQRIKKLNSVDFNWGAPVDADGGGRKVEAHKKSKIKHDLLTKGVKSKSNNGTEEYSYLTRTTDFWCAEKDESTKLKAATQSSRGRIRMPSRRMQDYCDVNFQVDSFAEVHKYEDDLSTVTSADGVQLFPGKLLGMVNDLDETNPNVIEWLPNGQAFRFNDEDSIVKHIKGYFRHNKLNSLIRQLNLYGFTKTRDEEGKPVFSHPYFTRESTKDEVNSHINRFGKPVAQSKRPVSTRLAKPVKSKPPQSKAVKPKSVSRQVGTISRRVHVNVGDENRYIKQLCKMDGCYKYIASHCEGYCMSHYNEANGIKPSRRPYKKKIKAPLPVPEEGDSTVGRPKNLRQLDPVRSPSPEKESSKKEHPESPKLTTPAPSKKRKRASPSPKSSGRKKPMKSLYPQSRQNEYSFPTGHAVAHLPSDPAPEFGDGWTTRTLLRPRATPGKTKASDTYFYSPVHQFKFRSRKQVEIFLDCLKKCGNDEGKAIFEFKKVSKG